MKNRFMLAPLTNWQSHEDGTLSEEEYHWLTMRAKGGFGLTMTCAAHVQEIGKGFPGQLGTFSDDHLPGLRRLAEGIKGYGSLSNVQLHHAGMRSPSEIIGQAPVSASDDEETGARALTTDEVRQLRDDFIAAAVRCDQAGFDGVEVHGANGYLLDEFLRNGSNQRSGPYGGALENRARLLFEVLEAVAGETPLMGLRLSPLNSFNAMTDSDPIGLITWLAHRLNNVPLAYLHLMRADMFGQLHGDVLTPVRQQFKGALVANMGYTAEEANAAIGTGAIDAVAFGTSFLANPDLPERFRRGAALNTPDPATFYSPGPAGYTDYPRLANET